MILARLRLRKQISALVRQFPFIRSLLKAFPKSEMYLVGGAVRDLLLDRQTKDYDFVVRGVAPEALEKFLSEHGQVDLVGRVFGVFKLVPGHDRGSTPFTLEPFDIALPRTEHVLSGTGGYKDFTVQSDASLPITADVERRDFTINAMAVNLDTAELLDTVGGLKDLKQKIIRTVGDPADRLNEDYSRILRGIRLACQLNFVIKKETWKTMRELVLAGAFTKKIHENWVVPRETLGKEFVKTLYLHPSRAFSLFEDTGIFGELIPEITAMKDCPQPLPWHNEGDVFVHTKMAVDHLDGSELWKKYFGDKKPSALTCVTVLLHDIAKPPCLKTPERDGTDRIRFDEHEPVGAKMSREICDRLALSSWPSDSPLHVDPDKLAWLVGHHLILLHADPENMRNTTIERYFFNQNNPGQELLELSLCDTGATIHTDTGLPYLDSLNAMLKRIKELEKLKAEQDRLPPPLLNGNEIMSFLNIPPGPEVGAIIEELRERQLSNAIKTKEEAELFVKHRGL